ncbi:MAG: peptidoglycan-binding protein [Oscillospiraceae bacterium]|nr:peptidoglycan-binding protein [Oscillospiraceae bacterium]
MRAFGIDVSRWQGDFDFAKAKAEGVTFVIIKGGGGDDGLYVDDRFERNYAKARAQGLHVGCYWFSKALTAQQAKEEAAFFYDRCCKGKQFDLPVYIDVEHKSMLALSKKKLTDVILAWLTYMESYDMEPGVYSFLNAFRQHIDETKLGSIPRWVASWSKTCSYQPLGIWQFGGETNLIRSNKIAGVVCDQDYMLTDYPAQIKAAGKNGFAVTEHIPEKKEECEVKLPVLYKSCSGGYVRTVQILLNAYNSAGLTVDGVFGAATDKAVRTYQKSRKLTVDGVVGEKTWAQLLK